MGWGLSVQWQNRQSLQPCIVTTADYSAERRSAVSQWYFGDLIVKMLTKSCFSHFTERGKRSEPDEEYRIFFLGPPPAPSSFTHCANVQFSHDSLCEFNDRIKIRQNRGLWNSPQKTQGQGQYGGSFSLLFTVPTTSYLPKLWLLNIYLFFILV